MAATQNLYKKFVEHLAKGDIALKASGGASVKCALLLNTYTPNMSTDEVLGDVSAYEVSADGTGYAAGGVACALSDPAIDGSAVECDIADAEWASLTLTARYAVWYVTSETAGLRYLIALRDFGEDVALSAQLLRVQIHADGLVKATIS